jgi:uroporphyrin-III C-methyltransferase
MGMGKLQEIVGVFSDSGKQDIPIAIIQNGTTKDEKIGVGTIGTICNVVKEKQLSSPAIIVIGEVVKNRTHLNSISQQINQNAYSV